MNMKTSVSRYALLIGIYALSISQSAFAEQCLITPLKSNILQVNSNFGMRLLAPNTEWKLHKGMDFQAATNTPVLATHDGTVQVSTNSVTAGNMVWVRNLTNTFLTKSFHMTTRLVKEGEKVVAGQVIGMSGNTGHKGGPGNGIYAPHLHLEYHLNPLAKNTVPADIRTALCSTYKEDSAAGPKARGWNGTVNPGVKSAVAAGAIPAPAGAVGTDPNAPGYWEGVADSTIKASAEAISSVETAAGVAATKASGYIDTAGQAIADIAHRMAALIEESVNFFKGLLSLSEQDVMEEEISKRFLNPDWHKSITVCSSVSPYLAAASLGIIPALKEIFVEDCATYLSREQVYIDSFNNWMAYKKNLRMERIENLLAAQFALQITEDKRKIDDARDAAAKSVARKDQ